MAHSCPECGQSCYCNGDIDDILFDDDSDGAMNCTHVEICNRDEIDMANETYDAEDSWDDGD